MPKLTIPAPSALLGRPVLPPIDARVYPDRDELYADLGEAYRAAVRAFAAAGCRYLQLDEVFIAMLCDAKYRDKMVARGDDPDALLQLYAQLINTAIADAPADMTVTLHLCRGNFKSTYMGAGGYEAVEDVLFNEIDVDGYFMEYDDERSGGFEPLRLLPKGKRVALGLVTTKRGALESQDDLKRRIDAAAKFTPTGSALPRAAVRLRVDGGGQRADGGRAVGEARAHRRGRRGSLGLSARRPTHYCEATIGLLRA